MANILELLEMALLYFRIWHWFTSDFGFCCSGVWNYLLICSLLIWRFTRAKAEV